MREDDVVQLEGRIARLEAKSRVLGRLCLLLVVLVVAFAFLPASLAKKKAAVAPTRPTRIVVESVETQELVVKGTQGNARVTIRGPEITIDEGFGTVTTLKSNLVSIHSLEEEKPARPLVEMRLNLKGPKLVMADAKGSPTIELGIPRDKQAQTGLRIDGPPPKHGAAAQFVRLGLGAAVDGGDPELLVQAARVQQAYLGMSDPEARGKPALVLRDGPLVTKVAPAAK
jgi:hypothetical protein